MNPLFSRNYLTAKPVNTFNFNLLPNIIFFGRNWNIAIIECCWNRFYIGLFCDRWWFAVEFVNPYISQAELGMFEWTSDCLDKKPFSLPPSWLPTCKWECGGIKILRKLLLLGELRSSSMRWKVSLGVRFLDGSFGVNSCWIICE